MEKGKFKENYQLFKKAWKDPKYKAIMKLSLYLIFIFILIWQIISSCCVQGGAGGRKFRCYYIKGVHACA